MFYDTLQFMFLSFQFAHVYPNARIYGHNMGKPNKALYSQLMGDVHYYCCHGYSFSAANR